MSFQMMQYAVIGFTLLAAGFVGILFLSFPAAAIVAAVQLARRRKRNWRDCWARQRVLQRAVAGVAASGRTVAEPPLEDYPEPELLGTLREP